jgi:type II secretory pathway component GspD/PulD (secretin)
MKKSFLVFIWSFNLLCFASNAPSSASEPVAEGYTINYNTVSIIEYIRFASKICNTNFIFNEGDLNFTVSVVSDAPITPQNVMATLVQVLRINGLAILEQDNNLVIHKATDVVQIATLVTEGGQAKNAPIVTRIFRLKNTKTDSVAGIIRPMISGGALLEISPETKQLILTDVTANVDKVAGLIEILDSPHNILEIRNFEAVYNSPEHLIEISSQIMGPIAQGNPFILVPQALTNTIYIVSTPDLAEKAITVLKGLDVPAKKEVLTQRKLKGDNVFVYKAEVKSGHDLLRALSEIATTLEKSGIPEGDLIRTIESAKSIPETNSLLFVGSVDAIAKIKEFLTSLDVVSKNDGTKNTFFVFRPQNRSAKEINYGLKEMAEHLKETKGADDLLIQMILDAKVNQSTNTIVFSGEEMYFPRIKELLATIDTVGKNRGAFHHTFFLYKIEHASAEELQQSLKNFAKNLDQSNVNDEGLIRTINDMKFVKETNSLLFTGPDSSLKRLQEIVPSFDANISSAPPSNQFYVYKPLYQKGESLARSLKEIAGDLKRDTFTDPGFVQTLDSLQYVKSTRSLLFTGDTGSIQKLEALIKMLDAPLSGKGLTDKGFFLYQPKHSSKEQTENYLKQISTHLNKAHEEPLIEAIRSMKWIEASSSFLFNGSGESLDRVKELLQNYDSLESEAGQGYYIYKLQHIQGDMIEEELENLVHNLKNSKINPKVIEVVEHIRYVKETNSLLLTGDAPSIEEVKKMIAEYDYLRTDPKMINSSFFLYKPQHLPANQIEHSLKEVATNLKAGGLADPSLLNTIHSAKYVGTTNSFVFTGTQDSLQKVQVLLKDIDTPPQTHSPIQYIGKTTFLLYKLKNAGGPQIVGSIKSMTANLRKSGTSDRDFIHALNSMKYVQETNSLLFTGTEEALGKVESLIAQFDVASLASPSGDRQISTGQPNFFLYKPVAVPGPDLEKLMNDFAENLKLSGLTDPDLFNTIISMRWIEKTQSLVFTGTVKSLDQVKELLRAFDISANSPTGLAGEGSSIQGIDNTSFLVYKLQFHKGDEIQGALRQIAKDLINTNAQVNQGLLNAINSIQWLDVTNSLLCSGDQDTLTRLKELIKNLDIPLKQVFIEMLVIETTLINTLNFGLEWGANYKYRNKFGGSMFNTIPNATTTGAPDTFITNLSKLAPPAAPTPIGNTSPPIFPGFDLGVIGEVIKHNGQTFLTIGSIMSALQQDTETSIIMAPKILAQDGRTSTIFVGSNIPFTGSFVQNTGQNSTVYTSNVEYRDIGLNLTITPVLGNSDVVTLDINLDRTSTVTDITQSTINFLATNAQGIVTSKTSMQTTVHVPDKNFLILSGFVNNSTAKSKSGIPCLGGLPVIGAAFSQANDSIAAQNIVIFLRPYIVNSIDDIKQVTETQEEFFRDQAGSPFLERGYNEAVELIKTVDDE